MNIEDHLDVLNGMIDKLERRVRTLEQKIGELDQRTIGSVRFGPIDHGQTAEEITRGAQAIVDAINRNEQS